MVKPLVSLLKTFTLGSKLHHNYTVTVCRSNKSYPKIHCGFYYARLITSSPYCHNPQFLFSLQSKFRCIIHSDTGNIVKIASAKSCKNINTDYTISSVANQYLNFRETHNIWIPIIFQPTLYTVSI